MNVNEHEPKFKVGDIVRYINKYKGTGRSYYPFYGTTGIVKSEGDTIPWIQWECGSTMNNNAVTTVMIVGRQMKMILN